jgi:NADPH:quinone reductase-like Zn-dependent oxidoreductase
MRAFASDRFGDLDLLTQRDLPRPTAGPGQLVVAVKAAALNPADLKVLAHRDGGGFLHKTEFPLVPGFDFSGTVAEVGAGVTGRAVGDAVFGFLPYAGSTRGGTCAEYVRVQATTAGHKPADVSHEDAAAAATSGVYALQLLRDKARMVSGARVLVHGASGGVGPFAIQTARALGASHITGTSSASKLDLVRSYGADEAIDYRARPLSDLPARSFDVILDLASASSFGECAPLLAPRGTYALSLPSPRMIAGMIRALFSSKRCTFGIATPKTADLDQVGTWLADGKLRAPIERVYPFTELPAALAHQRTGVRGKLVVTI